MDKTPDGRSDLNRRAFIGALGGATAAGGSAVQSELYTLYSNGGAITPNPQVAVAISTAYGNCLEYLSCAQELTDSTGAKTTTCAAAPACPEPYNP